MKYRVELTAKWFNGLVDAIGSMDSLPTRWPIARESGEFKEPIYQLLYGRSPYVYRVLFIVRESVVYVLHIRHGARKSLKPNDITWPPETMDR